MGQKQTHVGQWRTFQSRRVCYTTCPKRRVLLDCKCKSSTLPTENEIEAAFDSLVRDRIDALFVTPDTYFISQRDQLAALTARYRIPANLFHSRRGRSRRVDELWGG